MENKTKKSTKKTVLPKDQPKEVEVIKEEPKQVEVVKTEKPKKVNKKIKRKHIEDIERFNPNPKHGLSISQVEQRQAEGYTNYITNKNTKSYKSIFFGNIFTFFNMLCFIVAGALIAVGSYTNLFFMVIFLANLAIGIIQEIKAKKTIEKIQLVTSPTATVIREGLDSDIPIKDIVLDDIIRFSTGKQISADCIVVDGEVEVNESLLTGESIPVKKKKGDTLFSGSFIVSGKCLARVNKVGEDSYSSELANKAKKFEKPKSELLNSLRLIIKVIGIIIIPLAVLTFLNIYDNNNLSYTVSKTAGSVIGMIPAGMFLLTSMALAVGVIKLAKKRTLVQDMYSIEMLARTDVLCLDKTGTITDGTMKVNTVIQIDNTIKSTIGDIVGSMLTALEDNNQTSRALATHFGYCKEFRAKTILPFSSERKLSAVTFKSGETYAYGAPEFVLKGKNPEIDKLVKQYASKGFRVLLLAQCQGEIEKDKLPQQRKPIALIVIEDHIRDDAYETLKWFKENGVQIKIISGDNPITVSEVSKRVGVDRAELYISLEGLNEQQVIDASEKYTVFGRVSPEQKCILVKALKSKGHKVAMTGDGVNDMLALKEADCSIAMASGSEATRHMSNLVLLDSNFSSMPSVVQEGRRVINNIQNSSSLFLIKTLFVIFLTISTLILGIKYPFEPKHLYILEFCVIGIPSFFLALQPNTDEIKGRFLTNLLARALPGALIFFLNISACFLIYKLNYINWAEFITMGSLSISFAGFMVLHKLCKPFNMFRGILFASMLLVVFLILTFIPFDIFDFVTLSLQNVLFLIVFALLSYPMYDNIVKWLSPRK